MKNNLLFGIASIICSISLLIFSIGNATAFQSPSISLGSNPIFSTYLDDCSSTSSSVTVPMMIQVLVITDIGSSAFASETITLATASSGNLGKFQIQKHSSPYNHTNHGSVMFSITDTFLELKSGIVVPGGETLLVSCGQNQVTISGYYAHFSMHPPRFQTVLKELRLPFYALR